MSTQQIRNARMGYSTQPQPRPTVYKRACDHLLYEVNSSINEVGFSTRGDSDRGWLICSSHLFFLLRLALNAPDWAVDQLTLTVVHVYFLSLSLLRDKWFNCCQCGLKEHLESAGSDGVVSIRGVRATKVD